MLLCQVKYFLEVFFPLLFRGKNLKFTPEKHFYPQSRIVFPFAAGKFIADAFAFEEKVFEQGDLMDAA